MAVTWEEIDQTDASNASNISCGSNLSTQAGDLLVSHFTYTAEGRTITLPSGWTQAVKTEGGGITSQIAWKIATSADDNPSIDYTFSVDGGTVGGLKLAIHRITGHRPATPITDSDGTSSLATTAISTPSISMGEPNSLLIFFTTSDTATQSVSGYSIATSNPSWTERSDTGSASHSQSSATALRPETTDTGAGSATAGNSADVIGQLISISAPVSTSVSDSMSITESVSALGSYNINESETINMTDDVDSEKAQEWTNQSENSSSWTNQSK